MGTLLWDAKCIDVKLNNDDGEEVKYKVHFTGWNRNHDQWVTVSRLRKNDAENLKLKENLEKQYLGKNKRKKPQPTRAEKSSPSAGGSKDTKLKKKIIPSVETKDEFMAKVTFNIELPKTLNSIVVDDWDLVTRQKLLNKLPAIVTINNILDAYCDYK